MFFYMVDTRQDICRDSQVGVIQIREESQHSKISHAPLLVCSLNWETSEQSFNEEVFANEADGGFVEVDHHNINLRYLKYRYHQRDVISSYLPTSISLFWNLQTLIIIALRRSVIAPNEIWEMIHLRHLQADGGILLPDPPPSDKLEQGNDLVMRNLRTLMEVENFKITEEVCKRVSNIKELELTYCSDESYYYPQNLGCLPKLESLEFKIVRDGDHNSACREFAFRLTFPSSLKKLSLNNTRLDWEEITMMVGSLPNLETLYLELVLGSEWTLVEGKFLRLKSLTISRCCYLIKWNVDNSHFPVLENLALEAMFTLNELPSDLGTIPTLCSISLNWCNVSLAISAMRMLVEQEEEGNEGLRLDIEFVGGEELESFNKMVEEEGLTSNNLRLCQFTL